MGEALVRQALTPGQVQLAQDREVLQVGQPRAGHFGEMIRAQIAEKVKPSRSSGDQARTIVVFEIREGGVGVTFQVIGEAAVVERPGPLWVNRAISGAESP